MKKKIISLCLVAALVVVAIAGTSLAYFTDKDAKTNTFTLGNVDIELNEEKWAAPTAAVPDVEYAKDPVVANIGENDAWIRVDVTLSDAEAFTAAAEKHNITDLATIFADHDEEKWTLAGEPVYDKEADTLTYSYYYITVLKASEVADEDGESTEPLFTSVTIPAEFDNVDMEAIGADFTIDVTAHAIQTADSYSTAAGAFANYGE